VGVVDEVTALVDIDPTLVIGGDFSRAGGHVSRKWARRVPDWGDLNGDGTLDVDDLDPFDACMGGPERVCDPRCECADVDSDGDCDLADFSLVQSCAWGRSV